MAPRRKGPVVRATEAELRKLRVPAKESADATAALALARELDGVTASPAERASCARALGAAMARVRALAPPQQQADGVDELARRRKERRAGA